MTDSPKDQADTITILLDSWFEYRRQRSNAKTEVLIAGHALNDASRRYRQAAENVANAERMEDAARLAVTEEIRRRLV